MEQRRFKLAWSTGREETFLEAGVPCTGPTASLAPLPHTRREKLTGPREAAGGSEQADHRTGPEGRPCCEGVGWGGIRAPRPGRDPCPRASQWPGSGRRQRVPAAGGERPGMGGHRAEMQGPFPTSGHFQIHPASKPEAFRTTGSFFKNKKHSSPSLRKKIHIQNWKSLPP